MHRSTAVRVFLSQHFCRVLRLPQEVLLCIPQLPPSTAFMSNCSGLNQSANWKCGELRKRREGKRKKGMHWYSKHCFWPTFWTHHFFFRAQYTKLPKSDMERRTLIRPILLPDHNDIDASRKGCLINAFVQLLHSYQDLSCKLPHVVHSLKLRERKTKKNPK